MPDATFPSKLASGAGSIVDHGQYEKDGLRKDGEAVGSGPYKLDSFGEDSAVFSVNPNYKGTAEVQNSGVTLKFFHGDQTKLKKAILDKDVDIAYRGLKAGDIADIENANGDEGIDIVEGTSAEVQHLVFNMKDPVAGKLGVRKAIAYLLDRDALVNEVYQDTATPLYSIIPAGITGHNTSFFDTYGARPLPGQGAGGAPGRRHHRQGQAHPLVDPVPLRPRHRRRVQGHRQAAQRQRSVRGDRQVRPLRAVREGHRGGQVRRVREGLGAGLPRRRQLHRPLLRQGQRTRNNYTNSTITGTLIPGTAAQSDRSATDADFGKLQNIVAKEVPVLPVWQAKQYAVARENVYGLRTASTPRPSSASGRSARAEPGRTRTGRPFRLRKGRPALVHTTPPYARPVTVRRDAPARSRTRTPRPGPGRAAPASSAHARHAS